MDASSRPIDIELDIAVARTGLLERRVYFIFTSVLLVELVS